MARRSATLVLVLALYEALLFAISVLLSDRGTAAPRGFRQGGAGARPVKSPAGGGGSAGRWGRGRQSSSMTSSTPCPSHVPTFSGTLFRRAWIVTCPSATGAAAVAIGLSGPSPGSR